MKRSADGDSNERAAKAVASARCSRGTAAKVLRDAGSNDDDSDTDV